MWTLSVPWWELVARAVLVYLFLLALFAGHRQTASRSTRPLRPDPPPDLSNAVQNAMNGGQFRYRRARSAVTPSREQPVGKATFSPNVRRFDRGIAAGAHPYGHLFEEILRAERLTHHELMAALRRAGCDAIRQVHIAVLENDGQISVIPRHADPPPPDGPVSPGVLAP